MAGNGKFMKLAKKGNKNENINGSKNTNKSTTRNEPIESDSKAKDIKILDSKLVIKKNILDDKHKSKKIKISEIAPNKSGKNDKIKSFTKSSTGRPQDKTTIKNEILKVSNKPAEGEVINKKLKDKQETGILNKNKQENKSDKKNKQENKNKEENVILNKNKQENVIPNKNKEENVMTKTKVSSKPTEYVESIKVKSKDYRNNKNITKGSHTQDNLQSEDRSGNSTDKYKRSDSKYSKLKEARTRSNPNYEYNLEDADENEKDIILHGTIGDRINCLALLCARNPNEKNFKQLLMFCERQRNDVIYNTLKLLRDLVKDVKIDSLYIKNRIIKSFEMGARNQYIKEKVLEIIGVLIRAEIYPEEFINLLISRLIEKGEAVPIIENALQSAFLGYKNLIFDGIEDFYFKNDSFRCQYNVLKFLQKVDVSNDGNFFQFFDSAITSLDDYPQDQKDLMIELIVNSLARSYVEGGTISNVQFLRGYVKTARSAISVLSLLIKLGDAYTDSYILKLSRTTLLRNTKYEPEFLNLIYSLQNREMFCKLVDNSFFYSVPSILSLMLIAHEKCVDTKYLFSLHLFMNHFNPLVRYVAKKLLNKEKLQKFDPFDKVYVEMQSKILSDRI